MTSKDSPIVAIIGLGNMGSALADRLLSSGYSILVWNRTASKSNSLIKLGAIAENTVAEAAQNADITIICVASHEVMVDIIQIDSVALALRGKTLIQLGVVTAKQARQTYAWTKMNHISYLEGSILGVPESVKKATAMLVCSGSKPIFNANKNLLCEFGNAQHLSKTIGAAYEFDKIYFCFAFASALGFIQGAALAHASGFSIKAYTNIVIKRLPMFAEFFNKYGESIAKREYEEAQAPVEVYADCYAKSLELCQSLGVDDTLPIAMMDNFNKAIGKGYEKKEISAIFEVLLANNSVNNTG